jgi:hypothetical protein
MLLKATSTSYFKSRSFIGYKKADAQTSEVDAKLAPVNVGPWRVRNGDYGNHTLLVWQFNPQLCINGSHSSTQCSTTVTTETKIRSLPQLNNATDTVLLNNVGKVGELVLFGPSCYIIIVVLLVAVATVLMVAKIDLWRFSENCFSFSKTLF